MKIRENAETIVPVRAKIKSGFAFNIIQPPHAPKKNIIIASVLVKADYDYASQM